MKQSPLLFYQINNVNNSKPGLNIFHFNTLDQSTARCPSFKVISLNVSSSNDCLWHWWFVTSDEWSHIVCFSICTPPALSQKNVRTIFDRQHSSRLSQRRSWVANKVGLIYMSLRESVKRECLISVFAPSHEERDRTFRNLLYELTFVWPSQTAVKESLHNSPKL